MKTIFIFLITTVALLVKRKKFLKMGIRCWEERIFNLKPIK